MNYTEITDEGATVQTEGTLPMGVDMTAQYEPLPLHGAASAPPEAPTFQTSETTTVTSTPMAPQSATAAVQQQPQIIVPPVSISIPPEVMAVFQQQIQTALGGIAQAMAANVETTIQGVIAGLPQQEAQAIKKNPWLIPALDILVGVVALGILVYFVVAAIGFNNAQAKSYLGAAVAIVFALMSRSPISPPATPQNVAKTG